MDVVQEQFKVYTSVMSRSRWLVLVTVLLSSTLLIHIYLEQFSIQDAQLVGAIAKRLEENKPQQLKDLQTKLESERSAQAGSPSEEFLKDLQKYSEMTVRMATLDNMLKGANIPERELPLISVKIPGNDFLPIIGFMLLLFVVAAWLNTRSIVAALAALDLHKPEIRTLARLHFTFTGLLGDGRALALATFVQYTAFLFPAFAFLIAMCLDLGSIVASLQEPKTSYVGPAGALIVRGIILLGEFILIVVFTCLSIPEVREVQRMTMPPPEDHKEDTDKAKQGAGVKRGRS